MSEPPHNAAFISELRHCLSVDSRLTRRIVQEAEDHLKSTALRLQEEGCSREEAEREAVARFGCPQDVARGFEALAAEEHWTSPIRLARLMVTALTTIAALGFLVHYLTVTHSSQASAALRLGTVIAIVAYGVFTSVRPRSLVGNAGGIVIALLGAAMVAYQTLYVGQLARYYDGEVLLIASVGVLLIVQGSLSAIGALRDPLTT